MTKAIAASDKAAYSPKTRVRIVAGTHKGKRGVIGEAKGTGRNSNKVQVTSVGCKNECYWVKPDWVEVEEFHQATSVSSEFKPVPQSQDEVHGGSLGFYGKLEPSHSLASQTEPQRGVQLPPITEDSFELDITLALQGCQRQIASDQEKTTEGMKLEAITPTATLEVDACTDPESQLELEKESVFFEAVEEQAIPSSLTLAEIQSAPDQTEAEGISALPQGHLWIDQIECLPQMQQRLYINPANVYQYQEMLVFSEPPPVTVYQVGDRLILVDGFHRIRASADDGRKTIPAIIKHGTWSDALLASCTANAYNGQAMSTADKRRAVSTMLTTLEQLPDSDSRKKWSNREIARKTGASESSVRNIRAELEMSAQIAQFADGDRVQVICPDGYQDLTYFRTNTLGTVQGLDKKKGLFIIPDNGSLDWDGLLQPSAWVHPERVIKLDSPTPSAQFAHSQLSDSPTPSAQFAHLALSADLDWQVNNIELPAGESTRTCGSETKPSSVKQETAQQGKSLGLKATGETTFPSIPANPDVGEEPVLVMASATNGAAIANGKPDVVAVEIAIGMRHLTPEQLAWAVEASADAGLPDTHLKSIIKAASLVLNRRHHPEYGEY